MDGHWTRIFAFMVTTVCLQGINETKHNNNQPNDHIRDESNVLNACGNPQVPRSGPGEPVVLNIVWLNESDSKQCASWRDCVRAWKALKCAGHDTRAGKLNAIISRCIQHWTCLRDDYTTLEVMVGRFHEVSDCRRKLKGTIGSKNCPGYWPGFSFLHISVPGRLESLDLSHNTMHTYGAVRLKGLAQWQIRFELMTIWLLG